MPLLPREIRRSVLRKKLLPEREKQPVAPLTAEQQALVVQWARIPAWVVQRKFSGRNRQTREELIAAGYLALSQAAARFDPSLGVKFSTYAIRRVWGRLMSKVRDDRRQSAAQFGTDDTIDSDHGEGIAEPGQRCQTELMVARRDLADAIGRSNLRGEQLKVIELRWGLGGDDGLPIRKIAERMGWTQSKVQHLYDQGMKELYRSIHNIPKSQPSLPFGSCPLHDATIIEELRK